MGNFGDIIFSSLSQIWHLIPIIILILLFKKFINMKDSKNRRNKNEENEKNGLTLELRTVKKYEDLGYKVISNKSENTNNEQIIDLLCYKDDKTLLVKCENSSESKSIKEEDIMEFYRSAIKYLKSNDIEERNADFRYAVSYKDVFHKSAINILMDDDYNCKYVLI
ncbi:MAG: hypothetical protein ACERKK_09630 [Poseidonibacter sp.]|uniref:hypothetical protein n=1 Tax=Poseidonibacter sp. TaxID=2321188 RepID=UPI00359E3768